MFLLAPLISLPSPHLHFSKKNIILQYIYTSIIMLCPHCMHDYFPHDSMFLLDHFSLHSLDQHAHVFCEELKLCTFIQLQFLAEHKCTDTQLQCTAVSSAITKDCSFSVQTHSFTLHANSFSVHLYTHFQLNTYLHLCGPLFPNSRPGNFYDTQWLCGSQ